MNKLSFDLYEGVCEPFSLQYDGSLCAEFDFYPPKDGYLLLFDRTFRVEAGRCTADLRTLEDGAYTPYFYTDELMYSMPSVRKEGRMIKLDPPGEDFIYKTAARCRFAARRIHELERKVAELGELIEGTKLAIGDKTE